MTMQTQSSGPALDQAKNSSFEIGSRFRKSAQLAAVLSLVCLGVFHYKFGGHTGMIASGVMAATDSSALQRFRPSSWPPHGPLATTWSSGSSGGQASGAPPPGYHGNQPRDISEVEQRMSEVEQRMFIYRDELQTATEVARSRYMSEQEQLQADYNTLRHTASTDQAQLQDEYASLSQQYKPQNR